MLGNKIDISKGEKEYISALKYAQITNRKLNYGNNIKNWEQEQYERELRILKHKERIANNKNNNNNNKIHSKAPTQASPKKATTTRQEQGKGGTSVPPQPPPVI